MVARDRRQPTAADLHAEPIELCLLEAAFDERARVDAGRRVTLDVDVIAGRAVVFAAEEVIEPDVVQRGRRRERRPDDGDAQRGRRSRPAPAHVGDLDDADVEFRVVVSNSTDQFFFYCGGHGTPPQFVSSLNLSVENPLLDMLLRVAGAVPTAGGLIIPHAQGNDLSRVHGRGEVVRLHSRIACLTVCLLTFS